MWYFAKAEILPGMENLLRKELKWGEARLPERMVCILPTKGKECYIFGHSHAADPLHSGEFHDIEQYFNIIEFSPAEPFFIGEHASAVFHHQYHHRHARGHHSQVVSLT